MLNLEKCDMFLQLSLHFVWEMNAWGGMIFWRSRARGSLVVFPSTGREGPAWEREADSPELPSPQVLYFRFLGTWPLKSNSKDSQTDQTGGPPVISVPLLHSLTVPEPWGSLLSLLRVLSPLLLAHCSSPRAGITYRRLLEESTEVFGFNGMGWQWGKQIRSTGSCQVWVNHCFIITVSV